MSLFSDKYSDADFNVYLMLVLKTGSFLSPKTSKRFYSQTEQLINNLAFYPENR